LDVEGKNLTSPNQRRQQPLNIPLGIKQMRRHPNTGGALRHQNILGVQLV